MLGLTRRFDTYRAVQLLPEDVGMSAVTSGVGQPVDHDVEQLDMLVPPGHESRAVDRQRSDRVINVLPDAAVQGYDPVSGLVFRCPVVGAARGQVIPTG